MQFAAMPMYALQGRLFCSTYQQPLKKLRGHGTFMKNYRALTHITIFGLVLEQRFSCRSTQATDRFIASFQGVYSGLCNDQPDQLDSIGPFECHVPALACTPTRVPHHRRNSDIGESQRCAQTTGQPQHRILGYYREHTQPFLYCVYCGTLPFLLPVINRPA